MAKKPASFEYNGTLVKVLDGGKEEGNTLKEEEEEEEENSTRTRS